MEALTLAVIAASNILCFMVGAKVGQAVRQGKEVELPNPVKAIKEHQEHKKARIEQEKADVILQNIEVYNGTSAGQKEVPRW